MGTEQEMTYWVNVHRPDMQYRTDGIACWERKIGQSNWRFKDAPPPTWPSEWRTQVNLAELEGEKKE